MLIYVPSTGTFFSSSGVITVKRDQHELTSDCTGMVRLAVVSWKSSRIGREAQATPNSYTGSGPLGPCRVRRRRPCLRSRPRNLSVPNAVSSKRRDRSPRGGTAFVQTITWESRPIVSVDRRGIELKPTRIGAAGRNLHRPS